MPEPPEVESARSVIERPGLSRVIADDAGGRSPRDDAGLAQGRVGGRTTRWCPKEQG